MRIGIYLEDASPESGGASTLTKTIICDIKRIQQRVAGYNFIILFPGKKRMTHSTQIDGVRAISVFGAFVFTQRILGKIKNTYGFSLSNPLDTIVKKEKIDIVWFCYPSFQETKYPYIYTVWDLGHRSVSCFPEVTLNKQWKVREKKYHKMIPRACWVLTGNEAGRNEVIDNYPIDPNKIIVAPFPLSSFCRGEEKKPEFDIPDEFFFYPAQFWPHKNHITILLALKILAEKYDYSPKVFFTGSDHGNKKYISDQIKKFGLTEQVVFTGFLSYEEIKYMYTHATALLYASLMGPNNLPPIEATYLKCPVIISDLPGHREQLRDSALYFQGTSEEELAERIIEIRNVEVRKKIIQKEAVLGEVLGDYSYVDAILKILIKYGKFRRCWNDD